MVQESEEEKEIYRKGYYGFLMCIIGPITFFYFPWFMEFIIQQNMRLNEGSFIADYWAKPPAGAYAYIYVFNVTNPRDVINGKPPVLSEVGPFILRTEMTKNITRWNIDEGTVEFKGSMKFFTEDEMSDKSGEQEIFILNLAALGVATIMKERNLLLIGSFIYNMLMSQERLILRTTAKQFLIDGLPVRFLNSLSGILGFIKGLFGNILKNGAINIFYMLNNSSPELNVVATGHKTNRSMGEIIKFKGKPTLNTWGNEYCDRINGSEGVTFRYPIRRKIQYFFLGPFCRSMRLDYMGNDDIYGIPTKKFYMDSMFISPHYIRANKCFCPDNEYCRYNGTLPLGKCMFGLPITYSKPHFYGADPIFHEMIKGLKPDADKHQSYFHINTMLAVPLQVRVCIQINLNVKTSRNLRLVANLRD
ncbi:scavenger receptor class B member 1-like, partial [Centruroides sculpturatus]|uniref:scavenger receptor class B member 1-like n=1 Tax=Centruroides sculpturatus TaxID=218467 RepID=UPI000C6CFC72